MGHVVARHTRTKTPDGGVTWACTFTVLATGISDLSVVHRLSAPSLAEGRRSVRQAVEFLTGRTPLGPEAPLGSETPLGPEAPTPARSPFAPPIPALAPTPPPRNRRATDRPDQGLVPDVNSIPDASPRFPIFDFSRAETPSDPQLCGPLDPEPAQ